MPDRGKTIEDLKHLAKDDWILHFNDTDVKETAKAALALLKEQEPKSGHWIDSAGADKCSVCGATYSDLYPDYQNTHYCPNCGAKMIGQAVKWNDI